MNELPKPMIEPIIDVTASDLWYEARETYQRSLAVTSMIEPIIDVTASDL